jgi:hypothetical protein
MINHPWERSLLLYANRKWKAHRPSASRNRTIIPVHQDDPHRRVSVNLGNRQDVSQAEVNETETDDRQKDFCVVIDSHIYSDWLVMWKAFPALSLAHRSQFCFRFARGQRRRWKLSSDGPCFPLALWNPADCSPPALPPKVPPFAPCAVKNIKADYGHAPPRGDCLSRSWICPTSCSTRARRQIRVENSAVAASHPQSIPCQPIQSEAIEITPSVMKIRNQATT